MTPCILKVTYNNSAQVSYNTKGLKAKLACHQASFLLPVEIIERCVLATGPATVELLLYVLSY